MASRIIIGRLLPVDVPGFKGTVHVREDGPPDAPPLLMLHGFSGSLQWLQPAVPLLARDNRVIRVDLAGHGATGGRGADAPTQVRLVEAVLASLDAEHVVALGHSFGADVAVGLAEASERVDRLVIVTQAPDYSEAVFPRGNQLMTVPFVGGALARSIKGFVRVVGPLLVCRATSAGRPLATQAMADFRALDPRMFRIVLGERRERMTRRPLDAQVRAAGKPTLVILGGHDHFYGDRSRARYEAAGAQVHVIPDAGHSPLLEVPEETVAIIRAFLLAEQAAG